MIEEQQDIDKQEIKEFKLNGSDMWTGKSDFDLISDKLNEIIKEINQLKNKIKESK